MKTLFTKEQTCKIFGCSMKQLNRQYAANVTRLQGLLDKARLTDKKVNGYTRYQLEEMVAQYKKLASE